MEYGKNVLSKRILSSIKIRVGPIRCYFILSQIIFHTFSTIAANVIFKNIFSTDAAMPMGDVRLAKKHFAIGHNHNITDNYYLYTLALDFDSVTVNLL